MSKFIIRGQAELKGEIKVKGAKNAALKIIPAAILSKEKITIKNLPNIEDIKMSLSLIADLGAKVSRRPGIAEIDTSGIDKIELNPQFANKFRASIMFVAPILARFGEVRFPHPGGCVIGAGGRPIDIFIDGFEALGAKITVENGFYNIKAKKLKGTDFFFTKVSVTGTEAMIMAAVLASGRTILKNCAMEPEIDALARYLNRHGAKIEGAGSPTIIIEGVKELSAGDFNVIPDRIETGTFAIMAAAAKKELAITNCNPDHIQILLNIFEKIGVNFKKGDDYLLIKPSKKIKAYGIKTHEYPGFATDLASPYILLMTQALGTSLIHETIYDRRMLFTDLLSQMGADITMCDPHRAVINGPTPLHGRKLTSPDLRAGITLLIAGLIAQGTTEIDNIYQIDRGYENIDERLRALGADIVRVE